jgi:3-isopropylmalate/(R)-2-methylmalate dehydratase small subunit
MGVDRLFADAVGTPGYSLSIARGELRVRTRGGEVARFEVDAFRKDCLLNGWDDIQLTLRHKDQIAEFEQRRLARFPWLAKTTT